MELSRNKGLATSPRWEHLTGDITAKDTITHSAMVDLCDHVPAKVREPMSQEKPTSQEELDFHPHWSPCPLCGQLVADSCDTQGQYYDQEGKRIFVPYWQYVGMERIHPTKDGEFCYPYRDMPTPAPDPMWLRLLKWMMR